MNHANRWDVTGTSPIALSGSANEYGDAFDMMGDNFPNQPIHFNEWFKAYLGWLNKNQWRTAPTGGTYRLTRHDHISSTGIRGITVGQQSDRAYWLGFRRNLGTYASAATNFLANGVEIRWGMQAPGLTNDMAGEGSRLLNMTPATTNFTRHPLPIGQTFTDTNFNLSITPLSVGGTSPNEFIDLSITYTTPPVNITQSPTNQTVFAGSTVSFDVAVTGTGPITYQWTYNGVNIAGATNTTLTLTNVQFPNEGGYSVRVQNSSGVTNSLTATLIVDSLRPVAHWRFDEAPGSTVEVDSVGNFDGAVSPTGVGFVLSGRVGNAVSFSSSLNGLIKMGNVLGLDSGVYSISVWARVAANDLTLDYQIVTKHQAGSRKGYFILINDASTQTLVPAKASFNTGGSGGAARSISETPISTTSVTDGNRHQITAVHDIVAGTKKIYVDGAPTEDSKPVQAVVENTASFVIGGNQSGLGQVGRFNGLLDDIQVYNRALNDGEIDFLFQNPGSEINGAPFITAHPQGASVVLSNIVSFTVTNSGIAPFTYQWRLNGVNIPGATSQTLTLNNVQTNQAGLYSVRVDNGRAFIAKYDNASAPQWARQAGGTRPDSARAVTVDRSNQVFIAGYFSGAAGFGGDTLVSVANTYDAFFARLDTNGTFAFAQQAGGSDLGGDFGLGVAVDPVGNALLTGYFNGASALGSNSTTSAGAEDIFLTRFRPFTGAAPPPLNFTPAAGQLRLSWPLGSASFILQVAPDLRAQSWTDAVGLLGVETSEFAMTNQVTLTNRFFRLRKP